MDTNCGSVTLFILYLCVCLPAVPQGMSSVYFNKGENCIAAGRLFVEESIHDEFIARVVSETSPSPRMNVMWTDERQIKLSKKKHRPQYFNLKSLVWLKLKNTVAYISPDTI